jgi:uncharacterized membrane protein YqjE
MHERPSAAGAAADPQDGAGAQAAHAAEPHRDVPPQQPASVLGVAQQLLDDLRGALQARAHLFALEAQRAGMALVLMALFGVVAALLLVTAWFCLWALVIAVAVALGAPLWVVLLVALVLSLGAAWLLVTMVRAEARHLLFPASVRQLGRRENAQERADTQPPVGAQGAAGAAE